MLLVEATFEIAVFKNITEKVMTPDPKQDAVTHVQTALSIGALVNAELEAVVRGGARNNSAVPDDRFLRRGC